ncbi:MAG TPA: DUF3800 domain-containing protein [Elusimicrobiota bacterium]|nr:DUF3800 domain-containing protein [Elusimicrobiota bacterium]
MLFFIDESWQLSADRKHKAGVLCAIPIGSGNFNQFSLELFNLKKKHLGFVGGNLEIKGHRLLQRYYFKLEKKFSDQSTQLNLARDILSLCENSGLKAFATVTFPKEELDLACANPNQLERPFFFLFERINQFMKENHPDMIAKLVFDDRDVQTNNRISASVSNFLHKSHVGKSFDRILKAPLFAISKENAGIQMADICGYIIGRRFTGDRDEISQFFQRVKAFQYVSAELAGKLPSGDPCPLKGIKVIKKERADGKNIPIGPGSDDE